MRNKIKQTILLIFVLTACVFAQTKQNPYSIWCDYHSTYYYKSGQEFPSGTCYDVYKHTYYDNSCKCQRTHRATMKCAK